MITKEEFNLVKGEGLDSMELKDDLFKELMLTRGILS